MAYEGWKVTTSGIKGMLYFSMAHKGSVVFFDGTEGICSFAFRLGPPECFGVKTTDPHFTTS
jgi:hypothetical protein